MITSTAAVSRQGEDRRHRLILAAYHSIAEKGFEGLRVREVAAQVGINPATLHHYFPTKEALIQGVVEYVTQQLAETITSLEGTPVEQLHSHLSMLYHQMQQAPTLFVVLAEIHLRAQRNPAIGRFIQQQEAVWHAKLVDILQAGIRQGQWSADLDAEAVASTIITLMEGTSLGAATQPSRGEQAIKQLERWLTSR